MIIYSHHTDAQEMLGLTLSSFNGINTTFINPALATGSRAYLEVNILSGNTFFENDIYYFNAAGEITKNFLKGEPGLYDGSFKYDRAYNYFDDETEKSFVANARILGPSLMIQSGKHAFALTTSVRSLQSGTNIPYEIPIIAYEEISFERYHHIEFDDYNINMIGMTWSEIGLNYAYDFYDQYNNKLTLGIGVKGLFGMQAAYVRSRNLNYIIIDENTINIINMDSEFGYSLPIDNETNSFSHDPVFRGYGLGGDIGLVYTRKKSTINYKGEYRICAKPYHDYIYRIGISLLDFGSIAFKNNSELHQFNNVNQYWEEFDTIQFISFEQSMRSYSDVFYGDPDSSFVSNKISIGLPTAISLQFDYHINNNYYVSFAWVQPIRIVANTIWRPAQLAIIPRYENRFFGFSLPVSIYNYSKPRIGMAIRVYSLSIGTDNLSSWFHSNEFTGADIYFSFSFSLQKGKCLSTKKGACYNKNFGY